MALIQFNVKYWKVGCERIYMHIFNIFYILTYIYWCYKTLFSTEFFHSILIYSVQQLKIIKKIPQLFYSHCLCNLHHRNNILQRRAVFRSTLKIATLRLNSFLLDANFPQELYRSDHKYFSISVIIEGEDYYFYK